MEPLETQHSERPDFSDTNLHEMHLVGANLREASFARAILHSAVLTNADLSRANLHQATLISVDLSRANLSEANLRRANLSGADLSGAIIRQTVFADIDLSVAKLETIKHEGPSSIGLDTIYRSEGNLPESFLRGAAPSHSSQT